MSLKIAHISDTHLGFQDLDCVGADGVNVREADVYEAWQTAVDLIVREKPDAVVHTGDFFHRPCPTNRALIQGLSGLKKLSAAGIPVVVIAGNHSTPRTVYTSPILQSFRSLDFVHPVFQEKYEQVRIGDAVFHGVPHINEDETAASELRKAKPVSGKINILMLHTAVGADYLMEEYGERVIPKEMSGILGDFSYTALGHFHNAQAVGKTGRVWYSGSTERMSEKDAGKKKGFLLVTFTQGEEPKVDFVHIDLRPWLCYSVASCADKTAEKILAEIAAFSGSNNHSSAIVSIILSELKPAQSISLPNNEIASLFPGALSVVTRRSFREERFSFEHRDVHKESLLELFADYAEKNADSREEARRLIDAAGRYFSDSSRSADDDTRRRE